MDPGKHLRLALARGQIALGALALRAGFDIGMVEGPQVTLGAPRRPEFDEVLERGRAGLIDYRLEVPKHEFLSYLVHERGYLLHGTASADLEEVRPMIATDYDARTLEAVFATSDGIWPLFSSRLSTAALPGRFGTAAFRFVAGPSCTGTTSSSPKPIHTTRRSGETASSTSSRGSRSRGPGSPTSGCPVFPSGPWRSFRSRQRTFL